MLSEGERAERRALSERAYGRASGRPLSADEVARLQELEGRAASGLAPADPARAAAAATSAPDAAASSAPAHPPVPRHDAAEAPPAMDAPASTSTSATAARGPAARWLLPVVAAACLAVGSAAGWAVGRAAPAPSGAEAGPPELARPATDEDRMNASGLRIDADSTRFIARLDGVDVYLARAVEAPYVCLVMVSPATGPSAGCGEWSPTTGGIAVGPGDDLTVALGPLAPGRAPGSAFALSETVFAIRTG